jgi:hypothetical protein
VQLPQQNNIKAKNPPLQPYPQRPTHPHKHKHKIGTINLHHIPEHTVRQIKNQYRKTAEIAITVKKIIKLAYNEENAGCYI